MQDALGRYADGYLLGRFGFDVQPYGHVHSIKADPGIPASSMRSRAVATLRREPMNPTYANGWRSTCSSTAKSC